MTYHHDVFFKNGSYSTKTAAADKSNNLSTKAILHETLLKKIAAENWPNITSGYEVYNEIDLMNNDTLAQGHDTTLIAAKLITQSALGDKTFLLLGLLCLIYRGVELNRKGEDQGYDNAYFRMLRILICSFFGVTLPLIHFMHEKNVYEYQIKIFASTVLVVFLAIYMYTLCKESVDLYIEDETDEKKTTQNSVNMGVDK